MKHKTQYPYGNYSFSAFLILDDDSSLVRLPSYLNEEYWYNLTDDEKKRTIRGFCIEQILDSVSVDFSLEGPPLENPDNW